MKGTTNFRLSWGSTIILSAPNEVPGSRNEDKADEDHGGVVHALKRDRAEEWETEQRRNEEGPS